MHAPTASHADNVVTHSNRKNVLVAHVISTLTNNETILDEDMKLPPHGGHNPAGRTIALHSLAVLPGYQNKGIGSIALHDYIKRMNRTGAYDRIAIITYEELVPYYERFGFRSLGPSKAQFGGGGWIDMVRDLAGEDN
jgi:GNAT superfamily N-acetyltransferase